MKGRDKNLLTASVGMNRAQINFIDEIAREMRFSGGKKPSRSSIVRIFVKIGMLVKPDISGVKSEREAEERFLQVFKNHEYKT